MDLTCLNNYPPIPSVPKFANDSNTFVHQAYNPGSGGLTQAISASLARSTFSTNDIRFLINTLLKEGTGKFSSVSDVVKIKPIPSIIIYSSITLALFLILSIVFCAASCCCGSNKYQKRRRQQNSCKSRICVCLLVIFYLLGIGDMIYVAYRVNKATNSIGDTIETINRDIYPRAIAEHVEYLLKEIDHLDQYTVNDDSILINASKSMLVQAFDQILTEKYFIRDIAQTINITDEHFRELNVEVNKLSAVLPPAAIGLFKDLEERYRLIHVNIQIPIEKLCNYTNGTDTDIDQQLVDALDIVHVELERVNQTMQENILAEITPWEENTLLDLKTEEDIRNYINIGGKVSLVLVILLGVIPLVFFCLIFICRVCGCCQDGSDDNQIPMTEVADVTIEDSSDFDRPRRYRVRKPVAPADRRRKPRQSKKGNSSGVVPCLMRLAFFIMMIFLLLLVLLTIVFYTLDLANQGFCRTVHDDQPYLINTLSEELIKSNVIFGNTTDMNTTISNIVNDCGNQIHFSRKFLDSYWSTLANNIKMMMNTLDGQIYDRFIQSIKDINIAEDLDILTMFDTAAGVPAISAIVASIRIDFTNLEQFFANISNSNSTLPQRLVQPTIDRYQDYMKTVLEFTVDACPLPLPTVSKIDTLICHTFGSSISGLWLSVFIFMVLITVGCCIFGVCVYKRLGRPADPMSSTSYY